MEGAPKKRSQAEKGMRAVVAGAAFLGAVGATNVPHAEAQSTRPPTEEVEAFDANREVDALIKYATDLGERGIQDARGRRTIQTLLEDKLRILALSLDQQKPHFSSNSSSSIRGTGTPVMREQAKKLLLEKIPADTSSFGLQVLRSMLTPTTPPQPPGVEIRRYPNKDW